MATLPVRTIARVRAIHADSISAVQDYKFAERALYPLLHLTGGKRKIKLEDLKQLIPQDKGRVWSLLREQVETGTLQQLETLDRETKALAMLTRVSGYAASPPNKARKRLMWCVQHRSKLR
jgi:hypothetical protein